MGTSHYRSISAALILLFVPICARAQSQAQFDKFLVMWANSVWALPEHLEQRRSYQLVTFVDYVGSQAVNTRRVNIWEPAQSLPTAGKGSVWVYDYTHHIAAGSACCGYDNDFVFYAPAPPLSLPNRDLSQTHTYRGVHLGMTIAQAAAALSIPIAQMHLIGRGHETLEYVKKNASGYGQFLGVIYFWNNSAIGFTVGQESA